MSDGARVRDRRERLFDDLARGLATELPRRRLLLLALGVAVGAGALPGRARGAARRPQADSCGDGYNLCGAYSPLVVPGCCGQDSMCCQFDYDFHCCDPLRHRCGENRLGADPCPCLYPCCCRADEECVGGFACKDRCEPGSVRCGDTFDCCPVGASCVDGECSCPGKQPPCKGVCCAKDEECYEGTCKAVCKTETDRRSTHLYDRRTQCCTERGIEQKYPIQHFERCRETRVPRKGYTPDKNGCGPKDGPKFPDHVGKANFRPACDAHDVCYGTCRSDREACDARFGRQLAAACVKAYPKGKARRRCMKVVEDYHGGTIGLGSIFYDAAQSEACQCCP